MYYKSNAILKISDVEISFDEYNFEWSYESNDDNTPSFLELSIANLSKELRNDIKKNKTAIFYFGYNGEMSEFLTGAIDTVTTTYEKIGTKTNIKIIESAITNYKDISTSFTKGAQADYIIKHIASLSNISIGELTLVKNLTYKAGYVAYGKAINLIKQIAASCGSSMKVNGNIVDIYDPKSTTKKLNYLVDFTTGLLSEPEEYKEDKKEYDYKIKMMAYPDFKKSSIFKIDSETHDGYVQILKLNINNFVAEYVVMTR